MFEDHSPRRRFLACEKASSRKLTTYNGCMSHPHQEVPPGELETVPTAPIIASGTELVVPPASKNPYWVYLGTLRKGESKRTMRGCLDRIAVLLGFPDGETVPWSLLRYEHAAVLRTRLCEQVTTDKAGETRPWSPAHINKHLNALRKVLKTAWLLDPTQMSAEEYQRASSIEGVDGGNRDKAGRNIAKEELAALLAVCLDDESLAGARDAAMITLLWCTGMRREEVATARRSDYDPGDRRLLIVGKGGKSRAVWLDEAAATYLGRWLVATEHVRGPLFSSVDKWEKVGTRHMSKVAIANAIAKRRQQAGLPKLTPHDFRRTFAGIMLDDKADLATVQQLMGHASPATTAKYDRRPDRQRKAAVESAMQIPRPEDLRPTSPQETE